MPADVCVEEKTSNHTKLKVWKSRVWNNKKMVAELEKCGISQKVLRNDMYSIWSAAAESMNEEGESSSSSPISIADKVELRRRLKFHLLTLQSIRKSSIKWAGRCLAQHSDIRATCRHTMLSENFFRYMEEGCQERNEAIGGGREDPVFFLWRFKPAAIGNVNTLVDDVIDEIMGT